MHANTHTNTTATHAARQVESCLSYGRPCLLVDAGEELDPALEPLLGRTYTRCGAQRALLLPLHGRARFSRRAGCIAQRVCRREETAHAPGADHPVTKPISRPRAGAAPRLLCAWATARWTCPRTSGCTSPRACPTRRTRQRRAGGGQCTAPRRACATLTHTALRTLLRPTLAQPPTGPPHPAPRQVTSKVAAINFAVKPAGLEGQLLDAVLRHERPDLHAQRGELVAKVRRAAAGPQAAAAALRKRPVGTGCRDARTHGPFSDCARAPTPCPSLYPRRSRRGAGRRPSWRTLSWRCCPPQRAASWTTWRSSTRSTRPRRRGRRCARVCWRGQGRPTIGCFVGSMTRHSPRCDKDAPSPRLGTPPPRPR